MMRNIPFKKPYLLVALPIVLTLLSARFAFWNTWQAWHLNQQLNSEISEGGNVSFQPGYLERKNKNLSNAIHLYQVDTSAYRNTLITELSSLSEREKVSVVDVPTENSNPYYQTKSYKVENIVFQGAFPNLLRFYHKLYQLPHIGVIRSLQLSTVSQQEKGNDDRKLQLQVYLELVR